MWVVSCENTIDESQGMSPILQLKANQEKHYKLQTQNHVKCVSEVL